jgi:tape measure domain-containing protein
MVEIYTVGLSIETSQLERGTQQARQAMQGLGQAEGQLERQTKSTETAAKALGQTETALARSITVTEQAASKQGAAMGDLGSRSTAASQGVKTFSSGLQSLLGSLTSVQGAAAAFGSYLTGQFLRSVTETAGRMQTLQLSLDAITGSARAGADAMLFARQTANQLGMSTADVAATYRGFLANTNGLNLGITTTQQLFTGLVATTRLVGGGADTLANAVRGLTQTFAIGKLDAENWKGQVEEALPILSSALPRAMGLTRQAFMDQMQAGQLTLDRVLRPLVQVLGEQIPKAAGIAATSMESASARMKNSWTDLMTAIGQSSIFQGAMQSLGDAVRWAHDFGAAVGALDPRPLTAIEQITERINLLRREIGLSGQRSLETNQKLAELETQRLALIKLQAQQQQFLTNAEEQRRKAATIGPTGVTKTLTTQIDQETAAWQRRYAVGQTVGIPQLERERAKLADLNKVLQDHLDVLASSTPMTDADRKAREMQAIAVQDQIEATEGVIKVLQDEERERTKPQREARRQRGGLTEEQRAANERQREQNQLIDELTQAYDRATQSEAGLLALRARRLQFTEAEIEELLNVQALTQETERQRQAADEAQQAYESYYDTLMSDLEGIVRAQEHGISLEEAQEDVAIRKIARTDEEYQLLMALNAERRTGLALIEEQATFQDAILRAATAIEDQVRSTEGGLSEEAKRTKEAFEELADSLTGNVFNAIQDLTERGKLSFKDLATSIISDLTRILQQQFLMPKIASWTEKALEWGLGLLGAATRTPALGGGSPASGAGLEDLMRSQTGGPLRSGVTLVGEAGPEAIVSRGGRAMVFPSSHPISRMAVRAHLPGRQFGGTLPGWTTAPGEPPEAEKPAMPGAVPVGTRAVNIVFNITTPDATSFLRSRGEIQRAMGQAVRQSQYAT